MINKKKAYTLVELLVFMGIFSVFLVVLTNILTSVLDVRQESESTSSVQQDGNFLLNRFSYDISRANAIITPSAIGSTTQSLNITVNGQSYVYALNSNNLQLTANGVSDNLNSVSTSISNLSFTRIGNSPGDNKDTIQVAFTVTSNIKKTSGLETKSFQTTVGLR